MASLSEFESSSPKRAKLAAEARSFLELAEVCSEVHRGVWDVLKANCVLNEDPDDFNARTIRKDARARIQSHLMELDSALAGLVSDAIKREFF